MHTKTRDRLVRILLSLLGAALLLTVVMIGANFAAAPAGAAPASRPLDWNAPPGDPEIGGVTLTADIVVSDTWPGGLTRTVYFYNKSGGMITVTVAVTGTPPLSLTGGVAFSNTAETEVASTTVPFEGIIAYVVGTHHGSQPGVLFTATSTNSVVSIPITFVQDITAPVSTASSPAYVITGSIPITWVATDTQSGVYSTTLWHKKDAGGWTFDQTRNEAGGTFYFTPTLGDGTYYFATVAADHLGNLEAGPTVSKTQTIYDTAIAPVSGLTVTPAVWTNNNSFRVSWNDPNDPSGIKGVHYITVTPPTSNGDGKFIPGSGLSFTVATPSSGQWPVYVWLEDNAGNVNYALSRTVDLRFDNVPPSKPIITAPTHSAIPTFTVSWSSQDTPSGIATYTLEYSSTKLANWQLGVSGDVTNTALTVPYTDTSYVLRVTAFDRAGNSTAVTTTVYVGPFRIFLPVTLRNYPPPWSGPAAMPVGASNKFQSVVGCVTTTVVVYAGGQDGIYKGDLINNTWTQEWSSGGYYVYSVVVNPNNCSEAYAGVYNRGVYRRNSNGTWSQMSTGLSGSALRLYALALASDGKMYVGTESSGVYVADKSVGTWTPLNSGIGDLRIRSLFVDPADPTKRFAGGVNVVYRWNSGSSSWQASQTGSFPTDKRVWAVYEINGTVYAGVQDSGVYKSADGGNIWTQVVTGLATPWQTVYGLAYDPNTLRLYAGQYAAQSSAGVYGANTTDMIWSDFNSGLGAGGHPDALQVENLGFVSASPWPILLAATGDGVWWRELVP